jgi:hypothetical protein
MRKTRQVNQHAIIGTAGCLVLLIGCATATPDLEPQHQEDQVLSAEIENRAEVVRQNPVAYLHSVAERCRQLEQYTLQFTRHERRGLFQRMYGPEHIQCWFRRDPFSVRMKWLDEDVKYNESTYVANRHDGKVRFVTRWWSPPLKAPPGINAVDVQTPVTFGEAQRPVTDFGLQRMMERTLASLERAGDEVIVAYMGPLELPDDQRLVHHIHLEYPESQHRVPIQELYIDILSDMPAGTVLKRPSGQIDAAYFYADLDTTVALNDDDFLLEVERDRPAPAARTAADEP